TTGNLRFLNAPDFENPADANNDNLFQVQVAVSDGIETVTQNLNITVTNVDEQTPNTAPTFTSNTNFSIAENTTTVATITATDAEGDNLTYSLSGGNDQNLFAINATTGNLRFLNAPDFENPADTNNDNVFEVEVSVSDGTEVVSQEIDVTVTDVSEVEPNVIDLYFGTTENDGLIPGLIAENDLVFTGEGNDSVELGTNNTNNRVYLGSGDDEGLASTNSRFFGGDGADELDSSIGDGGNRLYGGAGDDEIIVGSGDTAFGGEGDDILDASVGGGNNRLYGGVGDDTFFLGSNDNAIAGAGDDILFAQGANSTMTGGAGADQFWIVAGEIPTDANIINDFEVGIDVLGVNSNLINSFAELTITDSPDQNGAIIAQGDNNLAVLLGIEASAISESNFAFSDSVI
ncbi:MAG: cadherin domain-containing protein, partial [Oscillatoria sp. PMC 1068.18]|nr:cadherin domain-containing protein [Oscillatoria sp. PMC 1068.18]